MRAFASAPRTLAALLGAVVAVLIVQVLLFSPSLVGLLWPALVAALSLSALFGSRRAAVALKYLLYFMSVASLLLVVSGPMSAFSVGRTLVVGVFLFAVGRYLGRSSAVAQFYASKTTPSAVGG
jgi:hypothetical protein